MVKRLGVKRTEMELPEPGQFDQIVKIIEDACAPQSKYCADLVRFLAFSGCRISEAKQVTWADVDFDRGEIRIKNAKRSKTSSQAAVRLVPFIPEMRALLTRLRDEHKQRLPLLREHRPDLVDRVCMVGECEKSLTAGCKKVGAKRITHHDLRHLFATRCIESGVDIPTVSRWLGHVDGGALAMKVYGHLRREHSSEIAKRVSFTTKLSN
jgi:integrase